MKPRPPYRLDHVHVLVADRELAARWYARTFGLVETERSDDPYGPLVVSGDGGETGLALFTSRVPSDPNRVVAFRVDAEEFLGFAERLLDREVRGPSGARLRPEDAIDHGDVVSLYVCDPDGNAYELLTREVDSARRGLAELEARSRVDL
jgi:catechol 2,3-dioxygenase-like lactoylglutathione lyase family enzyme